MLVSTKTSDYDLLEMISDKDEPFAKEAFVMFYNRYSSFLFNTCIGFCKAHDDPESDAADLVQEIIKKLLNGSWTFKKPVSIKPEKIKFHVRTWLYRIVENAFKDTYVKKTVSKQELIRISEENKDTLVNPSELIRVNEKIQSRLASEIDGDSKQVKTELSDLQKQRYQLILTAINHIKMSEKQKDVLKAYVDSGRFDENGNWILPDFRMDELMSKHSLKRNSIIKIKDRLVEKIKNETKNGPTNN